MTSAHPQRWDESAWCLHLWFSRQETTLQIERKPPHKHLCGFGSTDVFWRGKVFPTWGEFNTTIALENSFAPWPLNLCLHLAGSFLWDWQQKPELREKGPAMHNASSRCSWWCLTCYSDARWECIHWRGGTEAQCLDRSTARLQRCDTHPVKYLLCISCNSALKCVIM